MKERLAQEEAEAMEMEDEDNKTENTNNEKAVCEETTKTFCLHLDVLCFCNLNNVPCKHVLKCYILLQCLRK